MRGNQAYRGEGGLAASCGGHGQRVAPPLVIAEPPAIGEALVAEYPSLVSYSRRLTANGSEAVDLVQMLCARVLAQGPTMSRPDNVSAWLRTALFHLFVDFRRRARWEIPSESAVFDHPVPPLPSERHASLTIGDVRAVLLTLPAHYRIPYELYTFENVSYGGIATRLGLPAKTVATRINRARRRLRGLLEEKHRL
jgi:RNA polymerase sigma-70 factor (ECF subfamily)